jgi:hypothetical protein
MKKSSAYRITPVTLAHPIVPATSSDTELEAPPDIALGTAELPPRLVPTRSAPSRPRVAATPPSEPATVEKPAEPLIEPDLTPEELNTAKSGTQQSLKIAESNLAQAQGKKLNSAQEDVVSKINGFVETARAAIKNGDWLRARNLAKKAEVLSYELVAKP